MLLDIFYSIQLHYFKKNLELESETGIQIFLFNLNNEKQTL